MSIESYFARLWAALRNAPEGPQQAVPERRTGHQLSLPEYRHLIGSHLVLPLIALGASVPIAFAISAGYEMPQGTSWQRLARALQFFGGATAIAAAAFAAGGIIGFLFGVPRTPSADGATQNKTDPTRTGYTTNTNLEKVSDWLSTIIVGLTLTKLSSIVGYLKAAGIYASSLLLRPPAPILLVDPIKTATPEAALASVLMVYFGIFGFFGSYLYSRLVLQGAFLSGDRAMTNEERAERINAQYSTSLPTIVQSLTRSTGKRPAVPSAGGEDPIAAIARQPLEAMLTPSEKLAWARAKVQCGKMDQGLQAYAQVLPFYDDDPAVKLEYALLATQTGDTARAMELLEQLKARTASPDQRQAIIEAEMFAQLYRPQPGGFEAAIQAFEKAFQRPDAKLTPSPAAWAYLACAYGQKYAWEKDHNSNVTEDDLKALRDKALNAARQAGEIWKPALRGVWSGESGTENDLVAFKGDPDFQALLS